MNEILDSIMLGHFLTWVSLWIPDWIVDSAWVEHAPFAFWLIGVHRPRSLVELGTHWGYSYMTFCQAIARLNLDAKCYAIDTWKGDDQAGFYGPEVYAAVKAHNDKHYSVFSTLLRSTFDDAVGYFPDKSVDLLHIDGLHSYEAVKHDYETWHPKLSERSVVLFHDINVRERNFGVWRLWEELKGKYPGFEFTHGHGLGVLGTGKKIGERMRTLLSSSDDALLSREIRAVYGRLGATFLHLREAERLRKKGVDDKTKLDQVQNELTQQKALVKNLEATNQEQKAQARKVINALQERDAAIAKANSTNAAKDLQIKHQRMQLANLKKALAEEKGAKKRIVSSRSWKATRPFRKLQQWLLKVVAKREGVQKEGGPFAGNGSAGVSPGNSNGQTSASSVELNAR